ncbi:LacI family DNA-binding transcriptional regulator [Streptomyces sp. N2-109]|uniref:LacI family DNA-binding transcriptional regulator n=1 Tax=Streptomyces gossypii TaxID=2883101 RepID=A0ABT2K069_9ACTN|nr:LacI family DNA-binding transcriptional regulator [Streptomyces gossypii]MCT2592854.1 LacI family DNA-binding transcriptional regulator [Streptomyces gossypii]
MTRTEPRPAGPTLAVVARAAAVSIPTASKVVNGRKDVAPDTRRRVTEALDALGYVRRPRLTPRHPPPLIDLVVHCLDSTWSGAVLRGVEEAAHEAGLEVMISGGLTRTRGGRPERDWLDRLALRGTSGVLFNLAELSPTHYAWLEQHRIPYAMIDPVLDPPPGVPAVGAANERGARSAVEHLLSLGHTRIAVVGGYRRKQCSSARVAGYRAAMAAAGLRPRAEYVRYADFDTATARARTHELFALPQPPTAVFACSDPMALGIYQALAELGLRIPQDVSVVGFDDLPEAEWVTPALTTVRQPLREMAATALRQLLRMRDGGAPPGARTELPTRLVERHSTAPPRPLAHDQRLGQRSLCRTTHGT